MITGLLLAGCSSDKDNPPPSVVPSASAPVPSVSPTTPTSFQPEPTVGAAVDADVLAGVKLSGKPGSLPTFEFTPPLIVSGGVARVALAGTGDVVALGDAVLLDLATVSGADGTALGDSYSGIPEMEVVNEDNFPPALLEVLVGERVGARLLFATPNDEGGAHLSAFEILSTQKVLELAEGTTNEPTAGLPVVTLAEDGLPSLKPTDQPPPTELVAQPLITGTGKTLTADAWFAFHYTSWLWDGREVDTSWDGSPLVQLMTDAQPGWQEGLIGQKVGSRVLVVMPPGAFDSAELEHIPAGSTLVFAIDILTAINPAV